MPTIRVNEVEIYYDAHGEGQPFIFFSETACDGEIWKLYQVPEFSKDHRVITHDYRGTGKSSKPSIDYTTRMFCDDAMAILDHLQVRPGNCARPFHGRAGSAAGCVGIPGTGQKTHSCVDRRIAFPARRVYRSRCARK